MRQCGLSRTISIPPFASKRMLEGDVSEGDEPVLTSAKESLLTLSIRFLTKNCDLMTICCRLSLSDDEKKLRSGR